ncbi:MAG: Lrp/AsnC family transcriptional regulator [Candidatus Thermoplasmatota archaeon]|jgi:DNA-binding Lrp family transcriptional regulator|nr:Lrp/AsnC family transcriptional regulator [Candidatus Thermoplasmatota archaeon]
MDKKILRTIYDSRDTNLSIISKKVGLSKSTVHNRLKKMKNAGYINGVIPLMEQSFIKKHITAVSLIKARYGPEYAEEVGKRIAQIKGIWAVYFVIGSYDFIALMRTRSKEELEFIVNELSKTEGIERSETIMVLNALSEDFPESLKLTVNED